MTYAAARTPLPTGLVCRSHDEARAPMLKFSIGDVLASVRSLYADELKPFGRVILKRIRENAAAVAARSAGMPVEEADPEAMPRVDPRRLRRMCEGSRLFQVFREEGREYSVLIVGEPSFFVDVCSALDPYTPEFWCAAASYLDSLEGEEMHLPGGRYACAQVITTRGLPFLEGRSLGEVCHFVQMAISQKRLLGYLEGQLVPYRFSEEWVKEQCAFNQQPTGESLYPLASWEDARQGVWQLLNRGPEPGGMVTLSNVKRLFRSRFMMELSETALGYPRLHNLLMDPRMSDICLVLTQGAGQVVVRSSGSPLSMWMPMPVPMPVSVPQGPIIPCLPVLHEMSSAASGSPCHAHELVSPGASPRTSPRGVLPPPLLPPGHFMPAACPAQFAAPPGEEPCQPASSSGSGGQQGAHHHAKPSGSCAASTTDSCEELATSQRSDELAAACEELLGLRRGCGSGSGYGGSSSQGDEGELGSGAQAEPAGLRVKNTFIHFAEACEDAGAGPSAGRRRRATSVPRAFGSSHSDPGEEVEATTGSSASPSPSPRRSPPRTPARGA